MRRAVLVALLAGLSFLAACGSHHTTAPQPPPPAPMSHQAFGAPSPSLGQCAPGDNHSLGECQPNQAPAHRQTAVSTGLHGLMVDLSNNDPVYGVGAYRRMRAHGVTALYVKLTEGTGFVDSTAWQMAHDARAAGLLVGGYDFAHVCQDSAQGERHLFEQRRQATGATQLPGVLDAEYGGGCGAGWVQAWRSGGEVTSIYTGAWWWDPSVGCYWPSNAQAWISGYGVSYPAMPCGRGQLDSWQFTDAGNNGVTHADLSLGVLGSGPKPPNPHLIALRRELPRDQAGLRDRQRYLVHLRRVTPGICKRTLHTRHPGRCLGARHAIEKTVAGIRRREARIHAVENEIHHLERT